MGSTHGHGFIFSQLFLLFFSCSAVTGAAQALTMLSQPTQSLSFHFLTQSFSDTPTWENQPQIGDVNIHAAISDELQMGTKGKKLPLLSARGAILRGIWKLLRNSFASHLWWQPTGECILLLFLLSYSLTSIRTPIPWNHIPKQTTCLYAFLSSSVFRENIEIYYDKIKWKSRTQGHLFKRKRVSDSAGRSLLYHFCQ